MKDVICVGDIQENQCGQVNIVCDDMIDIVGCIDELITDSESLDNYVVILGDNILHKANWNIKGEDYGDSVSAEQCKDSILENLKSRGLDSDKLEIRYVCYT